LAKKGSSSHFFPECGLSGFPFRPSTTRIFTGSTLAGAELKMPAFARTINVIPTFCNQRSRMNMFFI
jgi:hypothetical protein